MAFILTAIIHMKLGGPIVIMQEYSSEHTCHNAAAYLSSKIPEVDVKCLPK